MKISMPPFSEDGLHFRSFSTPSIVTTVFFVVIGSPSTMLDVVGNSFKIIAYAMWSLGFVYFVVYLKDVKSIPIRLQKHILNDLHVVIVGEPRRYPVVDPGERPGDPGSPLF